MFFLAGAAMSAGLKTLRVARLFGGAPHEGRFLAGGVVIRCALGRNGLARRKREGDGKTPLGAAPLLALIARRGRLSLCGVRIPSRYMARGDLWCDDARSPLYNRPLRAPSRLSHEALWRDDRLYDVVGVLGYNLRPAVRGRGSAIFFHIASDDLAPTAGCVALRLNDMRRLLPRLAKGAVLHVA